MTPEDAADLEDFTESNRRIMRQRLDHGAAKFGALSWRRHLYTDYDNLGRLRRAEKHLEDALERWRQGVVDEGEVRKRAADVANQAFMLADPLRQATDFD